MQIGYYSKVYCHVLYGCIMYDMFTGWCRIRPLSAQTHCRPTAVLAALTYTIRVLQLFEMTKFEWFTMECGHGRSTNDEHTPCLWAYHGVKLIILSSKQLKQWLSTFKCCRVFSEPTVRSPGLSIKDLKEGCTCFETKTADMTSKADRDHWQRHNSIGYISLCVSGLK